MPSPFWYYYIMQPRAKPQMTVDEFLTPVN